MELISLSRSQVLDEFRRALGLSTLRADCSVSAVEGVETDSWLLLQADLWYTRLLRTADPHLLPVENLCQSARTSALHDGMLAVRKDHTRVRTLMVKMADWIHPVAPVPFTDAAQRLARLSSPFGRPGVADPLAVEMPDGSLWLCPDCEGGLSDLLCVIDPRPDRYILHPSLLGTIADYFKTSDPL